METERGRGWRACHFTRYEKLGPHVEDEQAQILPCQIHSHDMNIRVLLSKYFLILVILADLNTKAARTSPDMGGCRRGLLETVYFCAL